MNELKRFWKGLTLLQRKLVKGGAMALTVILLGWWALSSMLVVIQPGEKGVVFHKFSSLDVETIYGEGYHFILPWNEMINYDVRQKTEDCTMFVLDKAGLEVGIDVSTVYHVQENGIGILHNEIGKAYIDVIIIPYTRNVIREVVGQFSAEELYSTKRDQLQNECETLLRAEFLTKNIILEDILIRDVNLPEKIKKGIEDKEAQEQINQKAQKKEQEQEYLANARVTEAEGIKSAKILTAEGEAESMRLLQEQLRQSPQYIELIKWQGFADKGISPYGENNVFGGNTSVIKGLK